MRRDRNNVLILRVAVVILAAIRPSLHARVEVERVDSPTCGIQEAIDALPRESGEVYIPAGVYVLKKALRLRDNITLRGAGAGTILRKNDGFSVPLAEDAEQGQNFVIVSDPSGLEPGMGVVVADDRNGKNIEKSNEIVKLDGHRVTLKPIRISASVEHGARLVNAFPLIWGTRKNVIIENLALDGNKQNQPQDAKRIWIGCGIKSFGKHGKVSHCWIYDTASDGIYVCDSAGGVRISGCEFYGCGNMGVHLGSGVRSVVSGNEIHHNESTGIYFCYGNTSDIISDNVIYGNGGAGIGGLSQNNPSLRATLDRYHLIRGNICFNNGSAGIYVYGGRDSVISGNICYNNCQSPSHFGKGGIYVGNARGYLISNNRCFDDQATFRTSVLSADALAGQSAVKTRERASSLFHGGQRIRISDSNGMERCEISQVSKKGLLLKAPLANSYRVETGAKVRGISTQCWGILEIGNVDENTIIGNDCRMNVYGGIRHCGAGSMVANNLGKTKRSLSWKTLELPKMEARQTRDRPIIDGNLSDPCWQKHKANSAGGFLSAYSMKPAECQTQVLVLYDDTNLYVAYTCREPDLGKLRADAQERDSRVYQDDCVELFVAPEDDPKTNTYFHLIINTKGVVDDRVFVDGKKDASWNPDCEIAAGKGQDYWTLELALPFESVLESLPPEKTWRVNFNRTRRVRVESSGWAPTFGASHDRRRWGYLTFEQEATSDSNSEK